jgi:hypothetical protein
LLSAVGSVAVDPVCAVARDEDNTAAAQLVVKPNQTPCLISFPHATPLSRPEWAQRLILGNEVSPNRENMQQIK